MAVVSSSRNAAEVLAAAGLADRFDVVVDGNVAAAERPAWQAGAGHVPRRRRPSSASPPHRAVGRRGCHLRRRRRPRRWLRARDRRRPRRRPRRPARTRRRRRRRRARRAAPDRGTPGRSRRDRRAVPEHLPQFRYPADPWSFVEVGFCREELPLTETLFAVGNGYLGLRGDHEEGRDANDPGHVHQRLPRDVEHPPRRAGVRVRHDRADDRQRARPEDHVAVRRRRAARAVDRRPRRLRAGARPAARHGQPRPHVAHGRRQARARPVAAARVARPPPRRGDHASRSRWSSGAAPDRHRRRGCSTGRTPSSRRARRRSPSPSVRPTPSATRAATARSTTACCSRGCTPPTTARWCSASSAPTARCRSPARRGTRSSRRRCFDVDIEISPDEADGGRGQHARRGPVAEGHQVRQLPHVALRARSRDAEIVDDAFELATRCTRSLDRVEHDGLRRLWSSAQEAWLDQFWASSDVELRHRRSTIRDRRDRPSPGRRPAGDALEPVPARPGVGADRRAGHRRQGRHRRRLRGALLLGHGDVRGPVPRRTRGRRRPASCCASAGGCCRSPAAGPSPSTRPARCTRGGRSTARRRRRTTPPAPRSTTSTPRSPSPSSATSTPAATSRSSPPTAPRSSSRPPGCGTTSASTRTRAGDEQRQRPDAGGEPLFHIHGVTGPDEYTAVVNDNLYTNVMARFNLRYAARVLELLARRRRPDAYAALARRVDLGDDEADGVDRGRRVDVPALRRGARHPPAGRRLPRPASLGLRRHAVGQVSAAAALPPARHLPPPGAQAGRRRAGDVAAQRPVLARGAHAATSTTTTRSPPATRRCRRVCRRWRRPRSATATSPCDYFREALFVDLADLHGNTRDGVHVASTGGVWGTVAFGFAGMFETGTAMSFDPSLPTAWAA